MSSNDQDILTMFDAGLGLDKIAAEFDVPQKQVLEVLEAHGREIPLTTRTLVGEDADVDAVIAEYLSDGPVTEILLRHKLTYTRLYTILALNGVELRKRQNAPAKKMQMEQAIQMYKDKAPIHKIVEETGVAQPQLHAELHRLAIPLRRPRKTR